MMRTSTLAAVAALLRLSSALPGYVTVSCPDVVTITQTVYPPGWTETGPIYNAAVQPTLTGQSYPAGGGAVGAAGGGGGVTTSWSTGYTTLSTTCTAPGVYPPPSMMGSSITCYMPGTMTVSPRNSLFV